jgi:hypothetical protein
MQIAESINISIEAINVAGEYNAYLFLKLKLARAAEADLNDCVTFLKHNPEEARALKKDLLKLIRNTIKSSPPEKKTRLVEIERLINN